MDHRDSKTKTQRICYSRLLQGNAVSFQKGNDFQKYSRERTAVAYLIVATIHLGNSGNISMFLQISIYRPLTLAGFARDRHMVADRPGCLQSTGVQKIV